MNLSPAWVKFLDSAGHSAVHWPTVGAPTATDREIMAWAAGHDSVVLTHDLDFSGILAATGGHKPSVVQIRADNLSTGAIGHAILAAPDRLADELAAGALVTIEPHQTRLTVLPLPR
jgi:predicted nuclease of predicted toxin-antitoxin system